MLLSLALLCICIGFFLLHLKPSRPKNFPPGPSTLPIVGNLLDLNLENPLTDFKRLSDYYGSIYSLFIGRKPAVVLNGVKAIKEALVNKAVDFAGRPQDLLVNDITQRKGVIFIDYDSRWNEHRRFALMTLKNLGMGKTSMEERIHDELQYTIETLENNIGRCLNPQAIFHKTSLNIISQVLLGKRYEYDDGFMKDFVHYLKENTKIANGPWAMLYDSFPIIRGLPLPFQKCFKNLQKVNKYIFDSLLEHKKTKVPGDPRDFTDCYLDELDKKEVDSSFSEDQLVMYAHDIYSAGMDTTSNTLLTGFLYLTCYPHIQDQCQQEIDQVVAGKGRVSFKDRNNMPYMQAVIHEVQRIANVAPLSIFHCTTKDTELMGYTIPNGTIIIENLTSVLNEEGQWKFPHEFNPENFLNEEGEFIKPEAFLPFSAGPRVCPGEGLSRMELFLVIVTLLRRFKFIWPEDAGEPDLTPVYGLTMSPRPYRVKVQLR